MKRLESCIHPISKLEIKIGDKGLLNGETLNKGIGMIQKWSEEIEIKTIFEHKNQLYISDKKNDSQGNYIEDFKKLIGYETKQIQVPIYK